MSHSRNQLQEETTNQLQELFSNLQNLQQQFAAFQTSQVSQSPLSSFQFQPQQIVSIPTQPIQQNFEEIQELFKTDLTQPDVPTNSGIIPETLPQFTNQEQEQEISDVLYRKGKNETPKNYFARIINENDRKQIWLTKKNVNKILKRKINHHIFIANEYDGYDYDLSIIPVKSVPPESEKSEEFEEQTFELEEQKYELA